MLSTSSDIEAQPPATDDEAIESTMRLGNNSSSSAVPVVEGAAPPSHIGGVPTSSLGGSLTGIGGRAVIGTIGEAEPEAGVGGGGGTVKGSDRASGGAGGGRIAFEADSFIA